MLQEPLTTEDGFFEALLRGDAESLGRLLADDFVIVDVMKGAEIGRAAFLEAVGTRQVEFASLEVVERRLRRYGEAAVVVGRTEMRVVVGGAAFGTASRYTHVFARGGDGSWRLVSAQGTAIAD
jgi:ketosteroid isomerase-like protein